MKLSYTLGKDVFGEKEHKGHIGAFCICLTESTNPKGDTYIKAHVPSIDEGFDCVYNCSSLEVAEAEAISLIRVYLNNKVESLRLDLEAYEKMKANFFEEATEKGFTLEVPI